MIPMHPSLISQFAAQHHAELTADAARQRLARQARTARRTAARTASVPPVRRLRLTARLRAMVAA
jgi:hypothetical protein